MTMPPRRPGPFLLMITCAFSLALFASALSASAASASRAAPAAAARVRPARGTGWLRLAHLSPNTPPVDVYLYSFGDPAAHAVLRHVSYGTVSPYLPVASGGYTVAMRSVGSRATSPPVLSTSVQVAAGSAYTVAGMGPLAGLRLEVFEDALTTPRGMALVRVIQASLRQHQVTSSLGTDVVARKQAFATVTSYQAISPGTWAVQVSAPSARVAEGRPVRRHHPHAARARQLARPEDHGPGRCGWQPGGPRGGTRHRAGRHGTASGLIARTVAGDGDCRAACHPGGRPPGPAASLV